MNNEELEKVVKIRRIQDPHWNDRIKARIYDRVIRSDPCEKRNVAKRDISFGEAFDRKIRKSVIGLFMDEKNEKESREIREGKLDIIRFNMKEFDERELARWEEKNNFVENPMAAIVYAIVNELGIDREYLENILTALRLLSSKITSVDKSLRKLRNLKILTLTDNFIREIAGNDLPRDLRLLELSGNCITSLERLCVNLPRRMTYLGLSKNRLTNDSKLLLLNCIENSLRVLDFQDNELRYLKDLLLELRLLENLTALALQGNPCSVKNLLLVEVEKVERELLPIEKSFVKLRYSYRPMVTVEKVCQGYKNAVLHYLPGIVYLDNIKLSEDDLKTNENFFEEKHMHEAVMYVYVYRILNLEKPPTEKNRTFVYFFEVELPLLDSNLMYKEEVAAILEENEKIPNTVRPSNMSLDIGYPMTNSVQNQNSTKPRSVYKGENIYQKELNNPPRVMCYKSKEFEWKNCLYFNEPIVKISCAHEDFENLNNTFKSIVTVKLVCHKLISGKQSNPQKTKNTKNSQESRDTIQAKIVLCKFTCSLKNIPWTDRSEDFYWDETNNFTAVPCHPGSLALLKYTAEGTTRSKKSPMQKTEKVEKSKSDETVALPRSFTVQMGFGLERLPNFSTPTVTDPTATKPTAQDRKKQRGTSKP